MSLTAGRSTRTVIRLFGTLLTIILMVYLLYQRWGDIVVSLTQMELWRLIVAFGFVLLSRLAVALRWHVLLRSVGLQASLSQSTRITFAGLFANNFLPTTIGGDVVRLAGALQSGFDAALSAASLVVDRLVGMFSMALALPLGAARVFGWAAISPTVAVASPAWPQKAWRRMWRIAQRLIDSLKLWLHQPRALLLSLAFSFLHMFGFFASLSVLLVGLGEHASFWTVAGLWSFVYFVTLLPISINGLGLQEVSIAYIFPTFGGVAEPSGLVLALIFRTFVMLASLPGAFFISSILPAAQSHSAEEGLLSIKGDSQP